MEGRCLGLDCAKGGIVIIEHIVRQLTTSHQGEKGKRGRGGVGVSGGEMWRLPHRGKQRQGLVSAVRGEWQNSQQPMLLDNGKPWHVQKEGTLRVHLVPQRTLEK